MLLRLLERLLRHGNNKTLGSHLRPKRHVLPGKGAAGGLRLLSAVGPQPHHPAGHVRFRRENERITCNLSGQRPINVCNGMFWCMQAQNVEETIVFDTRNATAHVDTYSTIIGGLCDGNPAKHPRFGFVTQMQTQHRSDE